MSPLQEQHSPPGLPVVLPAIQGSPRKTVPLPSFRHSIRTALRLWEISVLVVQSTFWGDVYLFNAGNNFFFFSEIDQGSPLTTPVPHPKPSILPS